MAFRYRQYSLDGKRQERGIERVCGALLQRKDWYVCAGLFCLPQDGKAGTTMKETYYIGFDAGTQSVKVGVYNQDWQCVAMDTAKTTLYYPQPGWVQMDVDEYYRLIKQCMRSCSDKMKAKGLDVTKVRAIMGDGIICGIAGIDADGNAVTPYINYLDSRTADDVEALKGLYLDIWAKETGNAEPNVMFPAMFARWFKKNIPDFDRVVKFVHNCPYVLLHLAGLKAKDAFIDWGAMSGWGLGYNVMKKEWSPAQLELLDIDMSYMPKIVKPWDIIGSLCEADAAETGFPAGTPICGGSGDTMESMMGSGILEAGRAVDVAGTCAMFCAATDGIIPELSVLGSGLIFNSGTLPNTYFYWGMVRTGGLALRWFKDSIAKKADDDSYYGTMDELAQRHPAGCDGAMFIPYLTGGNGDFPHVRGTFTGLTLDSDQGAMWRCVLEGIGYDYMEITDRYRKAGIDLSSLIITEGGSHDDLWNQIKADMLDTKVQTLKVAGGAVPTNCIVAAYSVGDIKNLKDILQQQLVVKDSYDPNREKTSLYRKLYGKRKVLLQALNRVQ